MTNTMSNKSKYVMYIWHINTVPEQTIGNSCLFGVHHPSPLIAIGGIVNSSALGIHLYVLDVGHLSYPEWTVSAANLFVDARLT